MNVSTDISQMTSRIVKIVLSLLPSEKHEFLRGFPVSGRPFSHIFRHLDAPLLSFSPGRRFPRPTPERVFVVDHQSGSGFSRTIPSAPPPRCGVVSPLSRAGSFRVSCRCRQHSSVKPTFESALRFQRVKIQTKALRAEGLVTGSCDGGL